MEKDTIGDDTPTGRKYHSNQEIEGTPKLTNINTEDTDVDASDINDDSTGMGKDDYLGKSKKEE